MALTTPAHVPAWKRLGLTLKHAKDSLTPTPAPATSSSPSPTKRPRDEEEQSDTPKKRKTDVQTSTPLVESVKSPSPEKSVPSSIRKSPTKQRDRRKSVSFSTDTKTEDGDTAQNAFRAWVAEQNYIEAEEEGAKKRAKDHPVPGPQPDQNPSPEPQPDKNPSHASAKNVTPPHPKKSKTKATQPQADQTTKKPKTRTPKPSDKPLPAYIQYLETYHNDKSNWKFNKSKQTDLLKNIWNIYRVPSHLNDALLSYVAGLQGEGARQRLKDAARSIFTDTVAFIRAELLEASNDPMDTYEARRAALEAAEKSELERLTSLGIDLGKIDEKENRLKVLQEKKETDRRSALLLKALTGNADDDESAEEEVKPEAVLESARARKKKRRSRTEVESDSDSDSDSESSSDDDSSDSSSGSDSDSDSESSSSDSDSSEDESSSDSE